MKLLPKIALGVALTSGMCGIAAETQQQADREVFDRVSALMPGEKNGMTVINGRNFNSGIALMLKELPGKLEADGMDCAPMVEYGIGILGELWDASGLADVKALGIADAVVSEDPVIGENFMIYYTGKEPSGWMKECSGEQVDVLSIAGNWPESTIYAFDFAMNLTPVAQFIQNKLPDGVEIPPVAVGIAMALDGRYDVIIAEDADGRKLLRVQMPDSENGTIFGLMLSLADSIGAEKNAQEIVISDLEGISGEIIISRIENGILISNCRDIDARIAKLPKLGDSKDFAALSSGLPKTGNACAYAGKKILNPMLSKDMGNKDLADIEFFVDPGYDSRMLGVSRLTGEGLVGQARCFGTFGEYQAANARMQIRVMRDVIMNEIKNAGCDEADDEEVEE